MEINKGDLLLIGGMYLKESEVTEISKTTKAIKIDDDWVMLDDIMPTIKGKIGTVKYKKTIFGTKRIVTKS